MGEVWLRGVEGETFLLFQKQRNLKLVHDITIALPSMWYLSIRCLMGPGITNGNLNYVKVVHFFIFFFLIWSCLRCFKQ